MALTSSPTNPKTLLERNAGPHGILAGSTHFSDVWARDALFASWGALHTGLFAPVHTTLETLTRYQKDGQIPLRVGTKHIVLALLGKTGEQGPVYTNDKTQDPALDPNTLYIITLYRYAIKQHPHYARQRESNVREALAWLATHEENNLLRERPYASWDDAIKKKGASIYNNSLYYGALIAAAILLRDETLHDKAEQVREQADNELWNGEYYDAWQGKNVLDVAGNLLAIYTGMAEGKEEKILDAIAKEKDALGHTLPKTNYPKYGLRDVYTPFYAIGMADYHNHGPYWSWIAALEALVRAQHGQKGLARALLDELKANNKRSEGIWEIYDEEGMPIKRLVYTSEKDFSWTAGMMLLAEHETFK